MITATVRPTDEQLALLSPFERRTFDLVDFVNRNRLAKAATGAFLRSGGMGWVYYCTRNLMHLVGFERLKRLRPERGLIIASNHRSFFDLYVVCCWLFRETDLLKRLYFPVRSDFFYQTPVGVFVNLVMSAWSMYPPVFREPEKRSFNDFGLKRLIELLQQSGSVVGMHPEGTRGKGSDPYQLGRAQPGIGKLIVEAKPEVVPIFIHGLGNDLPKQVWGNFDGSGPPVIIVAGDPLDLSPYYQRRNSLRVQKEIADHVVEAIQQLGPRERSLREQLERDPRCGPLSYPG